MKVNNILAGLCLILAFCLGTAHADTEKQEIVAELLNLTKAAEQVERVSISTLKLFIGQRLARNPKIPDGEKQKAMDIITETFQENIPELTVPFGKIYEQTFTTDELRELVAFYKSDTGKKLIESRPTIFQKAMIVGAAWGQKIQKEAMKRIEEELASKGYKI